MAVVVWQGPGIGPVYGLRRASGVEVSVAVWRSGAQYSLLFKRCEDGGLTWPPDAAAITIAELDKPEPWFMVEVGSILLVGNGINRQFMCGRSGDEAGHWTEMAVTGP